MTVTKKIS